jgi:TatA/E family protein of Tat protein translocase
MFGMGMPEILLILAIALIVIGPKKLPDLAKSLGRALGEFKQATSELKSSMDIDSSLKDVKSSFENLDYDIAEEKKNDLSGQDSMGVDRNPSFRDAESAFENLDQKITEEKDKDLSDQNIMESDSGPTIGEDETPVFKQKDPEGSINDQ